MCQAGSETNTCVAMNFVMYVCMYHTLVHHASGKHLVVYYNKFRPGTYRVHKGKHIEKVKGK